MIHYEIELLVGAYDDKRRGWEYIQDSFYANKRIDTLECARDIAKKAVKESIARVFGWRIHKVEVTDSIIMENEK